MPDFVLVNGIRHEIFLECREYRKRYYSFASYPGTLFRLEYLYINEPGKFWETINVSHNAQK